MLIKAVFAGFGGQGILSIGMNLAQAAMMEGRNVTYMPSYGTEVRGGTANCTVAISDEEIASPVASAPEFIVVMNQPALMRFQNYLESGGVLFVNSSLAEADIVRGDIEVVKVPANELADRIGMPRSANIIMLGVFARKTNLVSLESLLGALKATLGGKQKVLPANEQALRVGYDYLQPK